jgi:hypothetical protein
VPNREKIYGNGAAKEELQSYIARNEDRRCFRGFSPSESISRSGSRNIEYLFEYSEVGSIHYQFSA